jgi:hypothetical protein
VVVVSTHPGLFLASAAIFVFKCLFIGFGLLAFALLVSSQVVVYVEGGGSCTFDWRYSQADRAMYGAVALFFYWSIQLWLCMRYYVISMTTGIW